MGPALGFDPSKAEIGIQGENFLSRAEAAGFTDVSNWHRQDWLALTRARGAAQQHHYEWSSIQCLVPSNRRKRQEMEAALIRLHYSLETQRMHAPGKEKQFAVYGVSAL